jgi:ABC-type phosphate/phosphonate transport system substrate-binding protein
MRGTRALGLRGTLLFLISGVGLALGPGAGGEELSRPVRIGLSGSLFREVPEAVIAAMSRPFNTALSSEVGLTGELVKIADPNDLPRRLADNSVQFGLFTGYEFAWARQKYPDLKPLSIAVTEPVRPQVFVIVLASCTIKKFADLKGVTLSRPRTCRPHSLLCLERWAQIQGQEPSRYFAKINVLAESSETLDDVVEGVSQAALVDNATWGWYQKNKPQRTAKLRVAVKSAEFPATVVAYYPGNLDEKTVQLFHQGMINAHTTPTGKQLMSLWKMTGFKEVPSDYEQSLEDILKAYPAPALGTVKK